MENRRTLSSPGREKSQALQPVTRLINWLIEQKRRALLPPRTHAKDEETAWFEESDMTTYPRPSAAIHQIEFDLEKAEHGMGMPYDAENVVRLHGMLREARKRSCPRSPRRGGRSVALSSRRRAPL